MYEKNNEGEWLNLKKKDFIDRGRSFQLVKMA